MADESHLWRRATCGILLASVLARAIIVWRGGQLFWPDEDRYVDSHAAAALILKGEPAAAWKGLLGAVDHFLFKLAGVLPALVEQATGWDHRVGAMCFALFSVGSLWWVGKIVRRAGGDELEAFLGVMLAASAACLFYFARHLVPYDLGLFLILAALYFSLGSGWHHAFLAGVSAGLGFLAYNGYWQIGGAVLVVGMLANPGSPGRFAGRVAVAVAGLAAPIVALILWGRAHGLNVVQGFVDFAGTTSIGDLNRGWWFVFEYLWHAEHLAVVVWVLAALALLWPAGWPRRERRCWWWLGVLLLGYASMVIFSDQLHRIVIHARTVRALAPFFCLLAAAVLRPMVAAWPRRVWIAAGAAWCLQVAWNLGGPLLQVFPPEFRAQALAVAGTRPLEQRAALRLMGATFVHDPNRPEQLTPAGAEILLHRRHPLQYEPYLHEGYLRVYRERFRTQEISMRLAQLAPVEGGMAPAAGLAGYPGPLKITLKLPDAFVAQSDPLLVSGQPRAGDFLYLTYVGPDSARLGFDHWAYGGPVSKPLKLTPGATAVILVSTGALYPPAPAGKGDAVDPWADLRGQLVVSVNDEVIFAAPQPVFPRETGNDHTGRKLHWRHDHDALFLRPDPAGGIGRGGGDSRSAAAGWRGGDAPLNGWPRAASGGELTAPILPGRCVAG